MSTTTDANLAPIHELKDEMTPARARVLAAVAELAAEEETDATTTEIRRVSTVPEGSVHYHVSELRDDWRLIEEVAELESASHGIPAKVYDLTERGELYETRYTFDIPDVLTPEDMTALADDVDRLTERVDELEAENERLRDRLDECESFRESAVEALAAMRDRVEAVAGDERA